MPPEEVAALVRAGKKKRLWERRQSTPWRSRDRSAIELLLPHRDPFLFLDTLTEFDAEQSALAGARRIDPEDPVFRGHFPRKPVYPGVLQLEAMGQLAICLCSLLDGGDENTQPLDVRLLRIHAAVFLAEVLPGDELTLLARRISSDEQTAICAAQILRGDVITTFAVMEMYFVEA